MKRNAKTTRQRITKLIQATAGTTINHPTPTTIHYNSICNIQRREALKTFTNLSLIGLTGSLSLSYLWQMKKSYATQSQQSLYESYLQSNPISHIQSPPIPLLLSSQLLYDTRSLLTLLMSDTPFVLLVDSHFSTFIAILQNLQESLQTQISINKQVESQLDSLLQSLQKGNDLVYYYKHTKNDDLAQTQCKDMIKNNLYPYNPYYFAHRQDSEATQIYKIISTLIIHITLLIDKIVKPHKSIKKLTQECMPT